MAEFMKYAFYLREVGAVAELVNGLSRKYGKPVWVNPKYVEVIRVDAERGYVEVFLNGWRVFIDNDTVEVYER